MGRRDTQTVAEIRDRLPQSVEAYDGIFGSVSSDDAIHVIIHEDEIGRFFKAVREMSLSTDTFRPPSGDGAIRGYVEQDD